MDKRNLLRTAAGIFLVLSVSKVIGFFREMLIAYRFGSGAETDAFFIASGIHSTIYTAFAAGLAVAIIPVLSSVRSEGGRAEENRYISSLLNLFGMVSIAMMVLGYLFSEQLVKLFAIGFSGEQLRLAVFLMRIGLPMVFFHAASAIILAYNHSLGKFIIPSMESILFNVPIILYLVFFHSDLGIKGLMMGFVAGYVLRVIMAWLPLKSIWRYSPVLWSEKARYRKTLSIMFPIMIGSMVRQINHVIDRTLASRLVSGSISALSYAGRTKEVVISLFLVSVVTVVYPKISDYIAGGEKEKLQKTMTYSMNLILLMVLPTMTGLGILSYPVIKVLFFRGAFTETNVLMTSSASIFYAIGLIGAGVSLFVDKVYFALNDSKTPMKVGMMAVGVNIILNLALVGPMKHNGLALATSVAATFAATVKFVGLRKKNIDMEYRKMFRTFLQASFASIVMGAVVYILAYVVIEIPSGEALWQFAKLMSVCGAGALVYAGMLYMLRVEEFCEIIKKAFNKRIKE